MEPKLCFPIFWNGQIHVHFELACGDFGDDFGDDFRDDWHDENSYTVTLSENRPLAGITEVNDLLSNRD